MGAAAAAPRSTGALAVMSEFGTSAFAFSVALLLAGCGVQHPGGPRNLDDVDVVVTIMSVSGNRCEVGPKGKPTIPNVPCDHVGAYLRSDLQLAQGLTYGLAFVDNFNAATLTSMKAELSSSGYRFGMALYGKLEAPQPHDR
jgi:hypothetical protein